MEQLKRLVREIHRRSLWQVLLIYVAGAWAAYEVIDTITDRLLLPDWLPVLAIVLFLIGLPVVLATAFIQEGAPLVTHRDPTLLAGLEGPARRGPVEPSRSGTLRRLFTWRNAIAGAVLALALWGVIAAGWLILRPDETGAEAAGAARRSIAVLPLENMVGAEAEQEYFVEGLTDVLISELSKISGLVVKSRTSVMRYRDTELSLTEIGRELDADFLIEGSVARGEDEVRVTVQLIDADQDEHIWTEHYRRPLADVLKLQEEVARAIAGEVQIRLQPAERERLSRAPAVGSAAREAYLQGRYHLGRHILTDDPEAARTAISYLRQAVERQPDWALAHALLARAYHWLGSGEGEPEYLDSAKSEALAALEIDPDVAEAHAALGFARLYGDRDRTGAGEAYRRALELDPNAHHWGYALYLLAAGRYGEAVSSFRRAEEREPFTPLLKAQLGLAYTCAGRPDQAIDYLRGVLKLHPDHALSRAALGAAYLSRGEHDRAAIQYERAAAGSPRFRHELGYVYARMGRAEQAREIRRELEREGVSYFPALLVALGEPDAALRQLERAYEQRNADLLFLRCVPFLGVDLTRAPGLRESPEFRELLGRIGYPD